MSLKFSSSILFDKPDLTITHLKINDILYPHKYKLEINNRSKSTRNDYKNEKLLANQAKTIENLSSKSRHYSLNRLLNSYNKNHETNRISKNKLFESPQQHELICPEKLKLFKAGVNYRSKQRVRGTGVAKVNIESLKQYFHRHPQQQCQNLLEMKMYKTIEYSTNSNKTNRFNSSRGSYRSIK